MKELMITAAAALLATGAWAASFSYQGVLKNADGSDIVTNFNKTIRFRLYDQPTGTGAPLWAREHAVLLNKSGQFTLELGDGLGSADVSLKNPPTNSLEQVFAENGQAGLYLGLEVTGSEGEIKPRQMLLPVPVANYAQNVTRAKGNFTVGGVATFSGGVNVPVGAKVSASSLEVQKVTVRDDLAVKGSVIMNGSVGLGTGAELYGSCGDGTKMELSPDGIILLWSGAANQIPMGWYLCDGQNGTPDLQDRFVVGAGKTYKVADAGGAATVALKTDEMPAHGHKIEWEDKRYGKVKWGELVMEFGEVENNDGEGFTAFREAGERWGVKPTITSTGGGQEHENRPPYYALCYIMKNFEQCRKAHK